MDEETGTPLEGFVFYSLVSPLLIILRKEALHRDLQWLFLDTLAIVRVHHN